MNMLNIFFISLAIATFFVTTPVQSSPKDNSVVIAINNPVLTFDTGNNEVTFDLVARHIFEPLVYKNPYTQEIGPCLAESWKQLDDLTWEFHLKKNVKYHNGYSFTAEDVKYTLDRIIDPENKYPTRGWYTWIDHIKKVDDYTVQIITKYPYPLTLKKLFIPLPMSSRLYKEKGSQYIAENPIGTGPFKFVEQKRGERIILERNENYWGKKPSIEKIVFRIIPEPQIQIAELISGGVDVIKDIPPDLVDTVKASPNVKVMAIPRESFTYIIMDAMGRGGKNPFQDIRVRKALMHAINWDSIIKNILQGYGTRTLTPGNPRMFGYNTKIKGYEFSPEKAKKLLTEAGYPNGFSCDFSTATDRDVFEAIAGFLANVGIKANLKWYGENRMAMFKMVRGGKLSGLFLSTWGAAGIPDIGFLGLYKYMSTESETYFNDPTIDKYITDADKTLNVEKRKEILGKIQERVFEQAYVCPGWAKYAVHGINKNLKGYEPTVDEMFQIRATDAYWGK